MLSIEGNIINIGGSRRARVEIGNDGIITSVTEPTGQADIIFKNELIFPGFIDLHVHARECADHSWDYKEDFTTASAAAINGGVVAFADMPNNSVPPIDEKSYSDKMELTKKSAVDVVLYAGIGLKTTPVAFVGLAIGRPPLKGVPYKVFMSQSIGDLFFKTRDELEEALEKYRGQNVSFHCEDPEIMDESKSAPTHELRRPKAAETSAVDFALELIKKYELKGKICHCSTIEGLQKIISAKKSGFQVTVEVTPHHLYFDVSSVGNGLKPFPTGTLPFLQVNPPIRQSPENRLALITALKNGDIDYLATDHAPHTMEEKEKGISGMPHLDTYGPFVTWLMAEHNFSPADVMRVCSLNPGKFVNDFLPNNFGKIEKGFAGSLTVIDMAKSVTINKSKLKTKCGWSPFEGVTFPGRVAMTVVKGKPFKPF